jgi:endonuclease I
MQGMSPQMPNRQADASEPRRRVRGAKAQQTFYLTPNPQVRSTNENIVLSQWLDVL